MEKARIYRRVLCFLLIIIPVLTLIGWAANYDFFKRLGVGTVAMNPVTAVTFIILALTLELTGKVSKSSRIISTGFLSLVFFLSTLRLAEYLAGIRSNSDQFIFRKKLDGEFFYPNQMAPDTAFLFILAVLFLFAAMGGKKFRNTGYYLIFPLLAFSLTVLIGYLYESFPFYSRYDQIPMAFNTSLCFLIFSFCGLYSLRDTGFMKLFFSRTTSGILMRRLVPFILLLPPVLGFIRQYGERMKWYPTDTGIVILAALTTILMLGFTYLAILKVYKTEKIKSKVERNLRDTNNLLTKVFENIPDLLILKNGENGRYEKMNRATEDILHISAENVKGKLDQEIFGPETAEKMQLGDGDLISGKTNSFYTEEKIINHLPIWLQIKKVKVFIDSTPYILVVARDVTAERNIKNKLEKLTEEQEEIIEERTREMQRSNYELNQFVYRATHDLRNPLASMSGILQLAEMDPTPVEMKKYVGMMKKVSIKMEDLMNHLFEAMYLKNSAPFVKRIDTKKLLDSILAKMKEKHFRLKYEVNLHFETERVFICDEKLISAALRNVIENAIIFQDKKKEKHIVQITTRVGHQFAQFEITDNGPGTAKENLPKLFDMFFRGAAESPGAGLGLYTAKIAVEKVKGKIAIESETGKGTRVFITFPVSYPKDKPSVPDEPGNGNPPGGIS